MKQNHLFKCHLLKKATIFVHNCEKVGVLSQVQFKLDLLNVLTKSRKFINESNFLKFSLLLFYHNIGCDKNSRLIFTISRMHSIGKWTICKILNIFQQVFNSRFVNWKYSCTVTYFKIKDSVWVKKKKKENNGKIRNWLPTYTVTRKHEEIF